MPIFKRFRAVIRAISARFPHRLRVPLPAWGRSASRGPVMPGRRHLSQEGSAALSAASTSTGANTPTGPACQPEEGPASLSADARKILSGPGDSSASAAGVGSRFASVPLSAVRRNDFCPIHPPFYRHRKNQFFPSLIPGRFAGAVRGDSQARGEHLSRAGSQEGKAGLAPVPDSSPQGANWRGFAVRPSVFASRGEGAL